MTNPYIWNSPIKASLSGYWYGSLERVGDYGGFWSPMVNESGVSYSLIIRSGGRAYPDYYNGRDYGGSVRCLAQ